MGKLTGVQTDYGLDLEQVREYINQSLTQIDHQEMLKGSCLSGKTE